MFSLNDPDPYDAKTRCPVVISLAQNSQRNQEHSIGFKIYKVHIKRVFRKKHYIL